MKTTATALGALYIASVSPAIGQSDEFTNQIVAELQAKGYTYIELEVGPTRISAEAIRGDEELEVVYDRATGEVLAEETEAADKDDLGMTGLVISAEDEDESLDGEDGDEDDDDDEDDGDDDEEDDDD